MPSSALGYRSVQLFDGEEQEACDLCQGPPSGTSNEAMTTHFMNSLLGGMTQGLTAFPQYASEENVKPVAR
jgi:hypothetical protein